MRSILLIVGLFLISLQYSEAKRVYEVKGPIKSPALRQDVHSITDILNNIKNSAKNTWDTIENVVQNTKDKVKQWIENVKNRARTIREKLENRIREVREKSKTILEKIIGTGQLVKECFQKENEAVEELLEQIVKYVTSCISDTLVNLTHLNKSGQLELNETNFISDVENKMNNCVKQKDVEECLHKVRYDIYSAMENMENEVLTSRTEARGVSDDLLDAIVSCSVEGLLNASNVIATESIQIITCVVKG